MWIPASELDESSGYQYKHITPRERFAAQITGEQAIAALPQGEEIYRQKFAAVQAEKERVAAGEPKRDEIKAWMKANVAPISPHGVMRSRCGNKPNTSKSWLPALGTYKDEARNRKEMAYLNEHVACVRALRDNFDVDRYIAIYPQIEVKMQEYVEAAGKLSKTNTPSQNNYISGFITVAPEDIDYVFVQRLRELDDPNLSVRRHAVTYAKAAERQARNEARKAEDRRRADEAEARRAQQFIAGQMAQNQAILDAVKTPQITTVDQTVTTTTTTQTTTSTTTESTTISSMATAPTLEPLINATYWFATTNENDAARACERIISTLGPEDTSRVICKYSGRGTMASIHRYYCDAPEGEPKVEAYSAQGPNATSILTFYVRGITQSQRDDLYRAYRDNRTVRSSRHVDNTEIFAYRGLEDTWLAARDEAGRQIYFRSDADLRGSVIKHCGGGGMAAWETGSSRKVGPL